MFVRNDVVTTVIKRCGGQEKEAKEKSLVSEKS